MSDRFDIKGERHAAKVIDEFLSVPKTAEGLAHWVRDDGTEECRIGWALAVEGLPTRATLNVSAYPFGEIYGVHDHPEFPAMHHATGLRCAE